MEFPPMMFPSFGQCHSRRSIGHARRKTRFELERLDDRCLLSAGYQQINLVGYQPGMARYTDSNLNGWGMDHAPDGAFCVANTSTRTATFYDAQGNVQPMVIDIPAAPGLADQPLGPTGVVYNPTSDFRISENGKSAPATFIFDTLDGLICGWNPNVDPRNAILIADNSAALPFPASYTALALARNSQGHEVLYACDSGASATDTNDRIDMLDGHFNQIGSFTDPGVNPQADGTVFEVDDIGTRLYVTFTGFAAPFGGVVDVFDTDGRLLTPHHFAFNAPGQGPLFAPWAIVKATGHFGAFSNDLLIGNVEDNGNGSINAFDIHTGRFLGTLKHPDGTPIEVPGLWDLVYGGGTPKSGDTNSLYFSAGFTGENPTGNGLFGVIRAVDSERGHDKARGKPNAHARTASIVITEHHSSIRIQHAPRNGHEPGKTNTPVQDSSS
jgi:uncharacterized protein (TIGR03118 family)